MTVLGAGVDSKLSVDGADAQRGLWRMDMSRS